MLCECKREFVAYERDGQAVLIGVGEKFILNQPSSDGKSVTMERKNGGRIIVPTNRLDKLFNV